MPYPRFRVSVTVLLSLVVVLVACRSAEEAPETKAPVTTQRDDEEAVRAVRDREVTALRLGDAEAVLRIITDDAMVMPPDEPARAGKEAIRAWLTGWFQQFRFQQFRHDTEEIIVSRDWAFERWSVDSRLIPKGGGEAVSMSFKGIHVYERQPDGTWKITRDIWNSVSPAPSVQQQTQTQTEAAAKLRAEVTELRRQMARLKASQPADSSQAKMDEALRARLAEQQKEIERLREQRCKDCPAPPRPPRGIYLWDGQPPEPVEIPLEQVRG